ncbi:hypothetical protein B0S90_2890 [Caldicellulosiruptor bescii]|nr:hypothetical protein B0S90_2890 [Caldicellulosiruptor bescii]
MPAFPWKLAKEGLQMIKFALVRLNPTGATNLYILSNPTTMDADEIKKD